MSIRTDKVVEMEERGTRQEDWMACLDGLIKLYCVTQETIKKPERRSVNTCVRNEGCGSHVAQVCTESQKLVESASKENSLVFAGDYATR